MCNHQLSFLTNDDYEYIINNEKRPILIFFSAKWAENCQQMMCDIEKIGSACYSHLCVYCCDIDESPLVAMKHNVINIPCLVLCCEGQATARLVGLRTYNEIHEMLKKSGILSK